MKEIIAEYQKLLEGKTAEEILRWALSKYGREKIALASSVGAEGQVLTDLFLKIEPSARIITLDTGRLPQETHDALQETMKRYGMRYEVFFPERGSVEKMEKEKGPNLFYESLENRKLCCNVRKVEPLGRALKGLSAWVTGLRKEQANSRAGLELIDWDEAHQLFKLNPLRDWTEKEVWDYIHKHKVPYNKLHDKGYPSIGCAPCTRAVKPGEDIRAGRWWWELPGHKECGLHIQDGKVIRKKEG